MIKQVFIIWKIHLHGINIHTNKKFKDFAELIDNCQDNKDREKLSQLSEEDFTCLRKIKYGYEKYECISNEKLDISNINNNTLTYNSNHIPKSSISGKIVLGIVVKTSSGDYKTFMTSIDELYSNEPNLEKTFSFDYNTGELKTTTSKADPAPQKPLFEETKSTYNNYPIQTTCFLLGMIIIPASIFYIDYKTWKKKTKKS